MFYFIKLALTSGLFFMILTNLITNVDYYSYCKLTEYKEDLFNKSQDSKEFRHLCKDIFKDFSDHILLKYTFNLVYELIKPEHVFQKMKNSEAVLIIERIEHTYLGSLKYDLKFFKFTNFIFYVLNLYLILIVLPEFLTKFVVFLLDKCLFVIFLYFVAEGYLNFYTDIRLNTVYLISTFISYMPLTHVKYLFQNAGEVIAYIRNYLKI